MMNISFREARIIEKKQQEWRSQNKDRVLMNSTFQQLMDDVIDVEGWKIFFYYDFDSPILRNLDQLDASTLTPYHYVINESDKTICAMNTEFGYKQLYDSINYNNFFSVLKDIIATPNSSDTSESLLSQARSNVYINIGDGSIKQLQTRINKTWPWAFSNEKKHMDFSRHITGNTSTTIWCIRRDKAGSGSFATDMAYTIFLLKA